ncbi:MAG TPA: hypothetical protein PLU93_00445 [Treponemataceae bacterium]|jgi:predicted amidophosphoribosyltransferase|nr:hypothetical protein [Treponemataceae bacterium]
MEQETVCYSCGRTVSAAFTYCPWCAAEMADGAGYARALERAAAADRGRSAGADRMHRIEAELSSMEAALASFLDRVPRSR